MGVKLKRPDRECSATTIQIGKNYPGRPNLILKGTLQYIQLHTSQDTDFSAPKMKPGTNRSENRAQYTGNLVFKLPRASNTNGAGP